MKKTYNTIILVLFIFSSPFIIFLNNFIVIPFLYKICIFMLASILLIVNNFKINNKILILFCMGSIFYLLMILFNNDHLIQIFNFYEGFLLFGVMTLLFCSYDIDFNFFLKTSYKFALLNIVLFCINYFYFESLNYMDFGVEILFSLIFILVNFQKEKKLMDFLVILAIVPIILIFSNRSSSLALVVMLLFTVINAVENRGFKYLISSGITILISFIYLNINNLLNKLIIFLDENGIESYSIYKLKVAMDEGIMESSSGRDQIYLQALELIKSNNYLPVSYGEYQQIIGASYPHNVILEMVLNFGLVGVLVFVVSSLSIMYKINKIEINILKYFIILLFILVFIRLQFSSSYWLETYLWIIIGVLFINPGLNKLKSENVNYDKSVTLK